MRLFENHEIGGAGTEQPCSASSAGGGLMWEGRGWGRGKKGKRAEQSPLSSLQPFA